MIKILALSLACLLFMGLLVPQPAFAQGGILSGLTGILNGLGGASTVLQNFINNVMRPVLEGIRDVANAVQGILGTLRSFWEQIVWPVSEINRIRGLVQQLIAQFTNLLESLYRINVDSAQLPNPRQLEAIMRNKSTGDLPVLRSAFTATYGTVPAAGDAHPEERDLMDVDDAMAIDHLMMLKMADAGADRTITAAEAIAEHGLIVAPGTAAYSTAAAHIAALQSNAHLQKMIASALRQEAARLGHDTMALKRNAEFTRDTRAKTLHLNRR